MNIQRLTRHQRELLINSLNSYDNDVMNPDNNPFILDKDTDLSNTFPDGIIPLAYTTYGDNDEYEIQVNFNLNNMRYEELINNKLFIKNNVAYERSFDDFCNEIAATNFDDIVSTCINECAARLENYDYKYESLNNLIGNEEYMNVLWFLEKENMSIDDVFDKNGVYHHEIVDNYYANDNHVRPTSKMWNEYLISKDNVIGGFQKFFDDLNINNDQSLNDYDNKKTMPKTK